MLIWRIFLRLLDSLKQFVRKLMHDPSNRKDRWYLQDSECLHNDFKAFMDVFGCCRGRDSFYIQQFYIFLVQ